MAFYIQCFKKSFKFWKNSSTKTLPEKLYEPVRPHQFHRFRLFVNRVEIFAFA